MAQLSLGKLFGGFAQDYQSGNRAVEARSDQYTKSTGMSVFRQGFQGYMSPADMTASSYGDSGILVNSLGIACVSDPLATVPKTYVLTAGLSGTAPKLLLEESSAVGTDYAIALVAGHAAHNFTTLPASGDGSWGQDAIIYSHNLSSTTTRSLFYSWNDNTDGDIGRVTLNSTLGSIGSADFDFMSTTPDYSVATRVLSKDVPHYMVEGSDLVLYVLNGQYVASYDGNTGANGTWNTQALNLGAGWIGVSIRKYKDFIAIGAAKVTQGTVFNYESENRTLLWDGFSDEPNFIYDITDSRLGSIYVANDVLYAISSGKNNTTKLWRFTGVGFVLADEQLISVIGQAPRQNQLEYYDNCLYWAPGASSGNTVGPYIIAYGPLNYPRPGIHIPVYNGNGTNSAVEVVYSGSYVQPASGFLRNVDQGILRTSGKYGSSYALNYGGGFYLPNATVTSRLVILPYRSRITKFTLLVAQNGTGGSIQLALAKDMNTLTGVGSSYDLLNKTVTFAQIGTASMFSFERSIDDVQAFHMHIKWNHSSTTNTATILRDIIITYEPTRAY